MQLLLTNTTFSDSVLDGIITAYIARCEAASEYPWNYYYVKYPVFRPGSYGKLSNDNVVEKPYMYSVMQTKSQWSQNTYNPYLKAVDDAHLSRDFMGQRLIYQDYYVKSENDRFVAYNYNDDSIVDILAISQNEVGIDVEDRIIKLKEWLDNGTIKFIC